MDYKQSAMHDIKENAADILQSNNFLSSDKNMQHGEVSVMNHSIAVAMTSVVWCRRLHMKCDERALMRGALLHDYFLYDWHTPEHAGLKNLHGYYHPGIALENASREYELSDIERDIIKKHMWPLTIVPPRYKEAWIVTCADKFVSTKESIHVFKNSKRRREMYKNK